MDNRRRQAPLTKPIGARSTAAGRKPSAGVKRRVLTGSPRPAALTPVCAAMRLVQGAARRRAAAAEAPPAEAQRCVWREQSQRNSKR